MGHMVRFFCHVIAHAPCARDQALHMCYTCYEQIWFRTRCLQADTLHLQTRSVAGLNAEDAGHFIIEYHLRRESCLVSWTGVLKQGSVAWMCMCIRILVQMSAAGCIFSL